MSKETMSTSTMHSWESSDFNQRKNAAHSKHFMTIGYPKVSRFHKLPSPSNIIVPSIPIQVNMANDSVDINTNDHDSKHFGLRKLINYHGNGKVLIQHNTCKPSLVCHEFAGNNRKNNVVASNRKIKQFQKVKRYKLREITFLKTNTHCNNFLQASYLMNLNMNQKQQINLFQLNSDARCPKNSRRWNSTVLWGLPSDASIKQKDYKITDIFNNHWLIIHEVNAAPTVGIWIWNYHYSYSLLSDVIIMST